MEGRSWEVENRTFPKRRTRLRILRFNSVPDILEMSLGASSSLESLSMMKDVTEKEVEQRLT